MPAVLTWRQPRSATRSRAVWDRVWCIGTWFRVTRAGLAGVDPGACNCTCVPAQLPSHAQPDKHAAAKPGSTSLHSSRPPGMSASINMEASVTPPGSRMCLHVFLGAQGPQGLSADWRPSLAPGPCVACSRRVQVLQQPGCSNAQAGSQSTRAICPPMLASGAAC